MADFLKMLRENMKEHRPGLLDRKKSYAVLVPLVEWEGKYLVLYEVRAKSLHRQPGEVCFPGGKMETGETAIQCALRETQEELGIREEEISILGELDFVVYRDNTILYPVLGVLNKQVTETMCPNLDEVEEVFMVPLDDLMTTKPLEYEYELIPTMPKNFPYDVLKIPEDYPWRTGHENVAVYSWQGKAIWGITGRITRHLVQLISDWKEM